jgi:hypothetical protein
MSLESVLSISGLPGLFKLVGNRSNGLLVQGLDDQKILFASSRKHRFTPLETIAIYTIEDSTPIGEVFKKMLSLEEAGKIGDPQAGSEVLRAYFREVLPDYDELKVHDKDIRKVLKWFSLLKEKKLLDLSSEEEMAE